MPLPLLGLAGVAGNIISRVIDGVLPDKKQAAEAKAQAIELLHTQHAKELEESAKVIIAEARSDSWLARSWRPITMLFFLALIGLYWVGVAPDYLVENPRLVERLFDLLQIGIGGYIVSRGAEKVTREWKSK